MNKLLVTSTLAVTMAFGLAACNNVETMDSQTHHSTMPQHSGSMMNSMQHSPGFMNRAMAQLNLTEQQQAEMQALQHNASLRHEQVHGQMMEILTPEQREQLQRMHSGQDMTVE